MIDFIIFIIIIFCGLFFGKCIEKKHYTSILEREEKYKKMVVLSDKDLKRAKNSMSEWELLVEGTVVSIDSFKKLMASFVNFFWGRMKSYESLVDRARREAILKVKKRASDLGYNIIANLRIETSSIGKNAKKTVWSVEAIAYATGVKVWASWK